jgi:hypothetical protein
MAGPRRQSNTQAENDDGERKGFLLRLPPDLFAELRTWANQEVRSLNGHIEYVLREALKRRRGKGDGTGGGA